MSEYEADIIKLITQIADDIRWLVPTSAVKGHSDPGCPSLGIPGL